MKRKTEKLIKVVIDILGIVSCVLLGWMFISWIDVVAHNLDPEPVYQAWNLFEILL